LPRLFSAIINKYLIKRLKQFSLNVNVYTALSLSISCLKEKIMAAIEMKKILYSCTALVCVQLSVVAPVFAAGTNAIAMAQHVMSPSVADQQKIFAAADAGDVETVRVHINFVKAFLPISAPGSAANHVNLDFKDAEGNTPLIRAAQHNRLDIVDLLISSGANINAQNVKWETALVVSYNAGYYDVARHLLARGAADPYNAAKLIQHAQALQQQAEVQQYAEEEASDNFNRNALILGGGAALAAGAGLAGLGGGSDGGGGGSSNLIGGGEAIECGDGLGIHPENCQNSQFHTTEAQAQEGVLAMKGDYALAHGYDGRIFNREDDGALTDDQPDGHVLVAVIDSGVDLTHDDLDANIRTDLSRTCTVASGCVAGGTDQNGHGTYVAGIIAAERNGVGLQGVAPEAHIMSLAAIISGGSPTAATKYANANGAQVMNNSWSLVYDSLNDTKSIPIVDATGPTVPTFHPTGDYEALTPAQLRSFLTTVEDGTTDLVQFQTAVASHRLIVFSVGNSALTQPGVMAGLPLYFQGDTAPDGIDQGDYDIVNPEHYDWSRNWVASIALNDSGTLSSYSHQCGVAKDWCLAAPGDIALTTQNGGGYRADIQGTSFSAPNVTGAIAVMLGAFPHLDPEDVLEVLFETADDIGAAGIDEVYGRGLVNLRKATDPSEGGWTLSAASMGAGAPASYSFESSGLGLSAPFGRALDNSNATLIFQDSYNKDYTIPLSLVAGSMKRRETAFDKYAAFAEHGYDNVVPVGSNGTLGFSSAVQDPIPDKTNSMPFGKVSYQSAIPMGLNERALVGFQYKANMADAMNDVAAKNLSVTHAMKNPYLHLVDSANSSMIGYQSGPTRVRMAAYSGTMNGDNPEYSYRFGTAKNVSGMVSEVAYSTPGNTSSVAVENGVTVEENSFLGAETSGAFGIDKSSTYYTGVSGRYGVAEDITLIGNANLGFTSISAARNSLFTGFNNVMTSSFAFGAEFNNVAQERDTFGLLMSQPLSVMRGQANLALPVDIASGGSVLYQDQRLNLAPKGREFDIETYYNFAASERSDFSMNAVLRLNPDNDNTASNDLTLLTKYKLGF